MSSLALGYVSLIQRYSVNSYILNRVNMFLFNKFAILFKKKD